MKKLIFFLILFLGALQLQAQGCVAILNLSTPETATTVLHQASNRIRGFANYTVGSGYDSTLRAGVLVELRANTHIKSGSLFLAKIGPCTKSVARENVASGKFADELGFLAYPNPVESILNLSLDNSEISKITVTTLEGRVVATHKVEKTSSFQLDASSYSSGIYVLTVETTDGQLFRDKIIKK